MARFDDLFHKGIEDQRSQHTHRAMIPTMVGEGSLIERNGRQLINFSGNDYLGLSQHPMLRDRALAWTWEYGTGIAASQLVSGHTHLHHQIEQKIARFQKTEAALIMTSGWQVNASVLPALFRLAREQKGGAEPQVFTDRLNHGSLHYGCMAAGVRQIRYRHNDMDHLEHLLQTRAGNGMRFIITESLFSMDGDRADIKALKRLASQYDAFLYVDEAHACGVWGEQGRGFAADAGGCDLLMGTFSKGLGGFGAYVATSQAVRDWLVNSCSGLIYTTSLPPAVLGAMDAALDLIPSLDPERSIIRGHISTVQKAFSEMGFDMGSSSTQIIPLITGRAESALRLSHYLEERGILGVAIRPPTVPLIQSRIRFTFAANQDSSHVDSLIDALREAPL